jgi:hypothetical protein
MNMLKNHTFKQGDLVRAKIKTYNEMGKPLSQLYGIIVSEVPLMLSSLCYYRVEWFRVAMFSHSTVDSLVHEDSIEIVKHGE